MPKFEYKYISIVKFNLENEYTSAHSFNVYGEDGVSLSKPEPGDYFLDELGARGWEIATQSDVFIIFKRQISE